MCTDSDFEPVLKLPQPLDDKSYPSASHIAIQREIDTKKENKMGKIQPALITWSNTPPTENSSYWGPKRCWTNTW